MSALIYEIAWQRLLLHLFGSSLYAVASITSIFLGGLALGAALASRWSATIKDEAALFISRTRCVQIYGCLELAVAMLAVCLPYFFASQALESIFIQLGQTTDALSVFVRFVLAGALLLPPTMLMGATFPIVVASFQTNAREEGAECLYAINASGAVLGCVLAGFSLLPQLGLQTTGFLAAGVNVAVGLIAIFGASAITNSKSAGETDTTALKLPSATSLGETTSTAASLANSGVGETSGASEVSSASYAANEAPVGAPSAVPGANSDAAPKPRYKKKPVEEQSIPWSTGMVVAFVAGILAMMLQIAWTRWFQLLTGSSSYSLTMVLAMFLLGLTGGAWLVASVLRKLKQPLLLMATACGVSALYLIVLLYAADEMQWLLIALTQCLSKASGRHSIEAAMLARSIIVGLNILLPSMCVGVIVPLLFDCVAKRTSAVPSRVGWVYASNTVGTITGACVTGFLLIPGLAAVTNSGIQSTILLALSGQALLSLYLFNTWARTFIDDGETRAIAVGVVAFVVVATIGDLVFFRPSWNPAIVTAGGAFANSRDLERLANRDVFLESRGIAGDTSKRPAGFLFYKEGLNSAVSVEASPSQNLFVLKNDGKVEASIPFDAEKPAAGSDIATHGMLGSAPVLLHKGDCSKVLVIGYGSGCTAGAAASFPEVKRLEVCELEPAVLDAGKLFDASNGNPLRKEWLDSGRVSVIHNDGRYVLLTGDKLYDAIISQPADPWVSGAAELFTEQFWQLGKRKLAPNGVFCQWVQLYSLSPEYFGVVCRTFCSVFPNSMLVHTENAGECLLIGFAGDSASDAAILKSRLESATLSPVLSAAGITSSDSLLSAVRLPAPALAKMCLAIGEATKDNRISTDDNMLVEYASAGLAERNELNIEENTDWIKKFIPPAAN